MSRFDGLSVTCSPITGRLCHNASVPTPSPAPRYPELDLLRALAVTGMIAYHLAYDLQAFYGWNLGVFSGGWAELQRGTAALFLLLVGISFRVSWERARSRGGRTYPKYLRRGLMIFGCGMLVSLATYLVDPRTFVRFGILHCIGTTVLLLPLTARWREANMALGVLALAAGTWTHGLAPSWLLIPLGWAPPGFASVDWFPLAPWIGVPLIGSGLGYLLYARKPAWRTRLPSFPRSATWILWPGQHALAVYLAHQPVLLALLALSLGVPHP